MRREDEIITDTEPEIGDDQPEADALDQRRSADPLEPPPPDSHADTEASDVDLADQAQPAGPDEEDLAGEL